MAEYLLKFSLILFLILFLSCSKNELKNDNYLPYYHKINEAIFLEYQNLEKEADSLYNQSFKLVNRPFYLDCIRAAKNALNISNEKVSNYLTIGIENGLRIETIKEDSIFKKFFISSEWEIIKNEYAIKRSHYESSLNIKLGQELDSMFLMDQLVRENPRKIQMTMIEVDQFNKNRLISIIEENGYPGFSIVGEEIGRKFPVMFHHFSFEENEMYFNDILNTAMKNGEISPFRNAAYRDYNRILQNMKTLYGIHYQYSDGEKILQPVEDFTNINKRRFMMGLEPIENYLEIENIKYIPSLAN